MNWDACGDVGNGRHNLQREEHSTLEREVRREGRKDQVLRDNASCHCLCILMKAPSHVGHHGLCGCGMLFPTGTTRLCREALGLYTESTRNRPCVFTEPAYSWGPERSTRLQLRVSLRGLQYGRCELRQYGGHRGHKLQTLQLAARLILQTGCRGSPRRCPNLSYSSCCPCLRCLTGAGGRLQS